MANINWVRLRGARGRRSEEEEEEGDKDWPLAALPPFGDEWMLRGWNVAAVAAAASIPSPRLAERARMILE